MGDDRQRACAPDVLRRHAIGSILSARRVVAALVTALVVTVTQADARGAQPVRLTAAFDRDAALGRPTPLHIGLHVDLRQRPSPVATISMRYPQTLGVTTSGLGLATCRRTPTEFDTVVIGGRKLAGCPRNSVMARGRALGEIRLGGRPAFRELGTITVLAGPVRKGRLGLVGMVDGWHPIGAKLAYEGEVSPAPPPYGGALSIRVRQLPAEYDAEIALNEITFSVGSDDIVYHERVDGRTRAYRPGGLLLPSRCPRGGFPFDAKVTFLDGGEATTATRVPCPRRGGRSPVPADG